MDEGTIEKRMRGIARLLRGAFAVSGEARSMLGRAMRLYRREGVDGLVRGFHYVRDKCKLIYQSSDNFVSRNDYTEWLRRYDTPDAHAVQLLQARMGTFIHRPVISVLMPVYNTPLNFLDQAICSVRAQYYTNWELCICDDASTDEAVLSLLQRHQREDARIKLVCSANNGHISAASNAALALASGEFCALLDHDDLLSEWALFWVVDAINRAPDVGLIYSDEDKIDGKNRRYDPYFKCSLNYELLLAQNMVSHLGVYRTSLLQQLGGFRLGLEGAQDYDLTLRVIEHLAPRQIIHVPRILYHWRAITGSTALASAEKNYAGNAACDAVRDHLARTGVVAEVSPAPHSRAHQRVRFICPIPQPLVSIIIPTRDRADLLGMCLDTLIERTSYRNYEVIIIDNASVEVETRQLFARLPSDRFRILRDDAPFNYSALNNKAASIARGSLLCLMNNDIEIFSPGWLEEMVSFAARQEIGCVGARLWYPDGRLQHAGVITGIGGIAGHAHKYLRKGEPGYFGRAVQHQALSVVTAACLLVRKEIYDSLGGLDEKLVVAFNDVDFCLRVREAGFRNVWTPYAEMIHHESASRGSENTAAKQARFAGEVQFMLARWGDQLREDPAYSANLTLEHEDFSLAWPPRVKLV